MTCDAVMHTERRFCIRSNVEQIALMDAVAEISNEDRHELVKRLLRNEVLNALQTDLTNVIPTSCLIKRVEDAFSS